MSERERPLGGARGRQAEAARNDRLVLDAAREVFAEQGAAAPVAAVARRAGVGMGSLYRRYGSKTELLQHLCLLAMQQAIEAARAALAASDAWEGLAGYISACVAFGSGALAPLAGTIPTTALMRETSRHSRELLGELVSRGHREGALRPDVTVLDIAWLIELFGRQRPVRPSSGGPADPPSRQPPLEDLNVGQRLLAIALDGLRPQREGTRKLPGNPPTARHYEARWASAG